MAQYAATLEALSSRNASSTAFPAESSKRFGSPIVSRGSGSWYDTALNLPLPLIPVAPGSTIPVVAVNGYIEVDPASGPNFNVAVSAISGTDTITINGTAYDCSFDAIAYTLAQNEARINPSFTLRISGAAKTALNALGVPVTGVFEIRYRYSLSSSGGYDYAGNQSFCEFFDSPPDGAPVAGVYEFGDYLAQLLRTKFVATGPLYNVAANGQDPVYAKSCSYAALSPDASIVCRASDIGTLPNQIPTDVQNNSAERFRYHPSVFFRQYNDRVSSLAVRVRDTVALSTTQSGQPIKIFVNDTPQDESTWLLIIDGQPQICQVQHPDEDGFSVYTPLDAWNQAIAPLLSPAQANSKAAHFNPQIQVMRLAYLQYARCLSRWGTPTTQSNTTPIG